MWSEVHFMKAAATLDTLSVAGDLWGSVILMAYMSYLLPVVLLVISEAHE